MQLLAVDVVDCHGSPPLNKEGFHLLTGSLSNGLRTRPLSQSDEIIIEVKVQMHPGQDEVILPEFSFQASGLHVPLLR